MPVSGVTVVAAFAPAPALFALIHALKYEAKTELVLHLAAFLARAARRRLGTDLSLVPVPLHPDRERARGFNQSALLAHAVAVRLGSSVQEQLLVRARSTAPQARLALEERAANVTGAFRRSTPLPDCVRRWVLVDDVVTTGATAGAALAALGVPPPMAAVLTLCEALPQPSTGLSQAPSGNRKHLQDKVL